MLVPLYYGAKAQNIWVGVVASTSIPSWGPHGRCDALEVKERLVVALGYAKMEGRSNDTCATIRSTAVGTLTGHQPVARGQFTNFWDNYDYKIECGQSLRKGLDSITVLLHFHYSFLEY